MFRNGLYNVAGQAVRGALSLLTIPLLVRSLGLREYGVWALSYAILAILTLGEGGMPVAAAFFLSKDLVANNSRELSCTSAILAVGTASFSCFLGLLLWVAGPQIVRLLTAFDGTDQASAARALQIAGVAVSVLIVQRTLVGFEQALGKYAVANVLDVVQSLLINCGFIVVAWFGGRAVALMKWQVVASCLPLVIHVYIVCRSLRAKWIGFKWDGAKALGIIRYSAAAWSSAIGSAAFSQCDQLVVGALLGAPTLGIYAAITNLCSKINSFSGTAVQPLVPELSRVASRTLLGDHVRQATKLNSLIATSAATVLYVFADRMVRIILPMSVTLQTERCLQLAAVIYAIYSLNAPGYYILFSSGRARINAVIVVCCGLLSIISIFIGAHFFGLTGAISGNACYIGTLMLTLVGLRSAGVSIKQYLTWNAFPFVWFTMALMVGFALREHFLLRSAFVCVQMGALMLWFLLRRKHPQLELSLSET